MELKQAIQLISTPHLDATTPQSWADLGAGTGLFTTALSHLIGKQSTIYAIDKSATGLQQIKTRVDISLKTIQADFINDELQLPELNGILMANSLHYVKDQYNFLDKMQHTMKEGGAFLIVEYDTDRANQWVPWPLSFIRLKQLFEKLQFTTIEKIGETPSRYNNNNIYAALIR
ncbi:MAG: class I SAM-dependent methyltransferase [Niastella sp.]|nr:class I SAM-dependent methyltransferase [Niastella sp.]